MRRFLYKEWQRELKTKKTTLRRPDVRLFACSFSQFPFAPLFGVSPVQNKIRHALDIWEKRRKKRISNCVISKCISVFFFRSLGSYTFITLKTRWNGPIANKITHHKEEKNITHLFYWVYTVHERPVNDLNYWMDWSLKLSVVAMNNSHKCVSQTIFFPRSLCKAFWLFLMVWIAFRLKTSIALQTKRFFFVLNE